MYIQITQNRQVHVLKSNKKCIIFKFKYLCIILFSTPKQKRNNSEKLNNILNLFNYEISYNLYISGFTKNIGYLPVVHLQLSLEQDFSIHPKLPSFGLEKRLWFLLHLLFLDPLKKSLKFEFKKIYVGSGNIPLSSYLIKPHYPNM